MLLLTGDLLFPIEKSAIQLQKMGNFLIAQSAMGVPFWIGDNMVIINDPLHVSF